MAEIVVRPAVAGDFPAVASLLTALGRPALTPETTDSLQFGYVQYLARSDTAPQVAEIDGVVLGFLSLEFRQRLNRVRLQGWIPDLIVADTHRGLGAGKALLLRAFEIARERNCWSVTLETGAHRNAAHQLYRSAGMKELGLYFLKELP
jgi:GNAT superfamily N-acetyltransferase